MNPYYFDSGDGREQENHLLYGFWRQPLRSRPKKNIPTSKFYKLWLQMAKILFEAKKELGSSTYLVFIFCNLPSKKI